MKKVTFSKLEFFYEIKFAIRRAAEKAVYYLFIDKEAGKIIYETDLKTIPTGANDTVEYSMDLN
ncbi:MAG: hypothetical protein ACUVTN_09695 [Thermodesulfobacteriota bacterium]